MRSLLMSVVGKSLFGFMVLRSQIIPTRVKKVTAGHAFGSRKMMLLQFQFQTYADALR